MVSPERRHFDLCARWVVRTPEYYYYDRPQTLEIQIQQWHGKIFSLWYTKKRKDATDVWLEDGVGAGRGGDEEWLSADVKAGNAGFRIESYGIFVSRIRGTFFFCSK